MSEKLIINGGVPLKGEVPVSAAKNSVLKLMASAILSSEPITVYPVPHIRDVHIMSEVLRMLGAKVEFLDDDRLSITPPTRWTHEAPYELVGQMRASIGVLGPLLARTGKAKVALPGGCNIGSRKIDLHLKGLEAMGASVKIEGGFIEASAKELRGTEFILDIPSVGATENVLMAATLAKGRTVIENAAREPEIADLGNFLIARGAKISGLESGRIEIEGVDELGGGEPHRVIGDRIEAGTFLIAGIVTEGTVKVKGIQPGYLGMVLSKFREMGCRVIEEEHAVTVEPGDSLKAADIVTLPYPGFPTDLQAPMMVALSKSEGVSIVTENVFESRFTAVEELNRLGCDIRTEGHHAVVVGGKSLMGVPCTASDLRGAASLVLAGLAASGETEIHKLLHLDRGYERFEDKLKSLGARLHRVTTIEREAEYA